ncbi:MAG TPA: hypothetical protein VJ842_06245 [Pyrinomonadaceae bacterium]|nr:hypothetical protein [Pyrinomonadaceae bacterium]
MNTRCLRLVAISLLVMCAANVAAQQATSGSSGTLEGLRAAVERRRAVDRDLNIPDDRRSFNRELLREAEAQLRRALEAEKREWRGYLTDGTVKLSEEQTRRVEAKIADIEAELARLTGEAREESASPGARADSTAVPRGEARPSAPSEASGAETQPAAPTGGAQGGQNLPLAGVQPAPAPGAAAQQGGEVLNLGRELRKSARNIRDARAVDPNSGLAGFFYANNIDLILAALIPQKATSEAVAEAENARTDKQVEGNEAQSGTTSLVSKGGIPAVLGLATASGALTRSVSGNTITFQLNPVGLISALAQRGFISSYQNETAFERQLRNFAFGFSFDTSRGDTGGTFTGSGQQLSGLSARYNIINRRDPRDRKHQDRFVALARNQGVPIARGTLDFLNATFNSTDRSEALEEWVSETDAAVRAAASEDLERVLEAQIRKLPIPDSRRVSSILDSLAKSLSGFEDARGQLLKQVASGLVMTVEYNLERRGEMPDLSNIRFIAEKGPYDGKIDLTFNSSVSFFHSRPSGGNTNRLRDFRFAGQIDVPLRETRWTGKPLLSFAGRYQRLLEDEMLPNGGTLSAKGDIAVGQLKLTIPIRGTAFKIPLSLSFSNRTELLHEKEIRGNFGFTFDLDSIFARFNPFKP